MDAIMVKSPQKQTEPVTLDRNSIAMTQILLSLTWILNVNEKFPQKQRERMRTPLSKNKSLS